MYLDLVENAEVGSMMNEGVSLGPLFFWALLSLTAVVAGAREPSRPMVLAQAQGSPTAVPQMTFVAPQRIPPPRVVGYLPGGAMPMPAPSPGVPMQPTPLPMGPGISYPNPNFPKPPIPPVAGPVGLNVPPTEVRRAPNIYIGGSMPTANPTLVPGSPVQH